ncbi:MAG: hypothetical protein D8M61_01800 [Ignavibacteriae bacterium]|jgi:hypothetical protein|nr:hypothetical protein [Ignavibacteriota bacterium]
MLASGGVRHGTSNPYLLPQGYETNSYHSFGFSNIVSATIADIATSNPASLTGFSVPSFGFKSEYSTKINNAYYGIGYERLNPLLPKAAGLVFPIDNFWIGASYNQKYSGHKTADILVTTTQDPTGSSGETESINYETAAHCFSLIGAIKFDELFNGDGSLSIGAQLNYDYLKNNDTYLNAVIDRSGSTQSFKLGTVLTLNSDISFGLLYESGIEIIGEGNIEQSILVLDNDPLQRPPGFYKVNNDISFESQLPGHLAIGVAIHASEFLWLSQTSSLTLWKSVNDNYNNSLDLSVGGVYRLPDLFDISFGILYADGDYLNSSYVQKMIAVYLNAGIRYAFSNFDVILEINDSHLLSNESRKHTKFDFGVGYSFN